jgi:hypothetical protein
MSFAAGLSEERFDPVDHATPYVGVEPGEGNHHRRGTRLTENCGRTTARFHTQWTGDLPCQSSAGLASRMLRLE